jgi:arylformamidase
VRDHLIDISMPLADGMVHWPGDPPPRITRLADVGDGDACTLTALSMSAHTGTHVDAPRHYLRGGRTVDDMPLAGLLGSARVIEIADAQEVTVQELLGQRIRRGDRVLLKTRNSLLANNPRRLTGDYVALAPEAARWLVERSVASVGIDGLSVDPPGSSDAHVALLAAGVWIIEGLRLAGVAAGRYELICLPLRLAGAEGSPARAVLRPRPSRHRIS